MHVRNLDTTDPATLEAALDAAPLHTLARVVADDGRVMLISRVPGGWHLEGDLAVASGDVADGLPAAVSLLLDEDYRDEGWHLLADQDPEEAAGLAAWAEAERAGRLSVAETLARARALLAAGDLEEAEAMSGELDDLDSVGLPEAGALRDEIRAAFGDDPYDEEDYR